MLFLRWKLLCKWFLFARVTLKWNSCHTQVSPHDNVTPGRKCYVEQWPRSTQNTRYDEVFKSQCPDAYSWQFDDLASNIIRRERGLDWTWPCRFLVLGTYQCSKANYEIILCPSGSASTNPPNPTTSAPSQGNFCSGQGFDPNNYWCDGGRLCLKGERACGSNPHACYKESMYNCVNGQLRPK